MVRYTASGHFFQDLQRISPPISQITSNLMVQRYLIYFVKVDFIWKQKREVFSYRTSQFLIEKLTLAGFQFESAPRRPTVYLYLTNERGLILIIVIIWLSRGEPRCHSIISASFSWPFKQSLIPGGDKTSSGAPGPKLKIWATHSSEEGNSRSRFSNYKNTE